MALVKRFLIFIFLLSIFSIHPQPKNPLITDGLKAYYPFNEDEKDLSGNGNDANVNDASYGDDRFNNPYSSLRLAGDIAELPMMPKKIISFWIKCEEYSSMAILSAGDPAKEMGGAEIFAVKKGDLRWPYADSNRKSYPFKPENFEGILFFTGDSMRYMSGEAHSVAIPCKIFDKKWHHLVFGVNSGAKLIFFIDGKEARGYISTRDCADALMPTYGSWTDILTSPFVFKKELENGELPVCFGKIALNELKYYGLTACKSFNGFIDDVRIFDRNLKSSEIKLLFEEK